MGAKVEVIDIKNLPRPVKLLAWMPSVSVEPKPVHKMIAIQNSIIKTGGWKVIGVEKSSQATQILITAEPGVVKSLKKTDCMPHYGLERINMMIISKPEVTPRYRAPDLCAKKVKQTAGG